MDRMNLLCMHSLTVICVSYEPDAGPSIRQWVGNGPTGPRSDVYRAMGPSHTSYARYARRPDRYPLHGSRPFRPHVVDAAVACSSGGEERIDCAERPETKTRRGDPVDAGVRGEPGVDPPRGAPQRAAVSFRDMDGNAPRARQRPCSMSTRFGATRRVQAMQSLSLFTSRSDGGRERGAGGGGDVGGGHEAKPARPGPGLGFGAYGGGADAPYVRRGARRREDIVFAHVHGSSVLAGAQGARA